jgi:photosystem II stability/assembly factor-like uncharacterized protein
MRVVLFSIFIFILSIPLFSQQRIHPTLPSDFINDLHYLNKNEVLFINSGGSIFKSYDGGTSWELKYNHEHELLNIYFIDDETGFIQPKYGEPLYTNDSGESWEEYSLSIYRNRFLPISSSIAIRANEDGVISLVDNFFNEWQEVYSPPTFEDSSDIWYPVKPYGILRQLEKTTSDRIVALYSFETAFNNEIIDDSLNLIIHSLDQGFTWDTLHYGFNDFLRGITFLTDSLGWVYSSKKLYSTIDGGVSWQEKYEHPQDGITTINVPTKEAIISRFWNNGQFLLRSTDSGSSWETLPMPDITFSNGRYDLEFFDSEHGFLFGHHFLRTSNFGNDWINILNEPRDNIHSLSFWSISNGIASTSGGLYKTENGGDNWSFVFKPEELIFNDPGEVSMVSQNIGWYVTRDKIFFTENGAENFTEHPITSTNELYSGIAFKNEFGILYSVFEKNNPELNIYESSHHYITTDAGKSWDRVEIPDSLAENSNFEKVQVKAPNRIYAQNRDGLWLSIDSAKTWNNIFFEHGFQYSGCFDFINSDIGVASTNYAVYFTKDGGVSWLEMPRESRPIDCVLVNKDGANRYRYIEVNEDSRLYRTSFYDDGYVFTERFHSLNTKLPFRTLEKLQIGRQPNIWSAGDGFNVMFYQPSWTKTNLDSTPSIPSSITLHQNYPNPFNPSTVISYSIPKGSAVILRVFDQLGREVQTLENTYKQAGTHTVTFDASSLSSGVYFYVLEAKDLNERITQKMMLIK